MLIGLSFHSGLQCSISRLLIISPPVSLRTYLDADVYFWLKPIYWFATAFTLPIMLFLKTLHFLLPAWLVAMVFDLFLRRMTGFYCTPISPQAAKRLFKKTPSGFGTSSANFKRWLQLTKRLKNPDA